LLQSSNYEATEAVKAVASAIREDNHLESLVLQMEDGFTDEAGVALAEALTINKTLRMLFLDDSFFTSDRDHNKASLGAQAYKAFGAMNGDSLFAINCMYALLRLKPSVCLLELNDTTSSVL
jgi:hypothetical protein